MILKPEKETNKVKSLLASNFKTIRDFENLIMKKLLQKKNAYKRLSIWIPRKTFNNKLGPQNDRFNKKAVYHGKISSKTMY